MTKKLLLLCIFLCIASYPQNKNIKFTSITIAQGLSGSTVYDVLQDKRGFIWIATNYGLNRFDGYKMVTYLHDPDNANSLSNNLTYRLAEDKEGNLWIATQGGGLNKLDIKTEKFYTYRYKTDDKTSINGDIIWDLYYSKTNEIYIAYSNEGFSIFNPSTGKNHRYEVSDKPGKLKTGSIREIYEDSNNQIWLASQDAGLYSFDRNTEKFTPYFHDEKNVNSLSSNNVYCISEDYKGNLWVGTLNGLNKIDKQTGKFVRYFNRPADESSLSENRIRSIYEDSDKNLWILTYFQGVCQYDQKTNKFKRIKNNVYDPASLVNNTTHSVYEDKNGSLWIGTACGVSRFDKVKQNFDNYVNNPSDSRTISHGAIWNFCEDNNKNIWICTDSDINRFDHSNNEIKRLNFNTKINHNSFYRCIIQDLQNKLWIGTASGLYCYDENSGEIKDFNAVLRELLKSDNLMVRALYTDSRDNIWIGAAYGLIHYDMATGEFTRYFHCGPNKYGVKGENDIQTIFEDKSGKIWIGTWKGIYVVNQEKRNYCEYRYIDTEYDELSKNTVRDIKQLQKDTSGTLWISTNNGLVKYNYLTGKIKRYISRDGLTNTNILNSIEDKKGNLWISSNLGLYFFNTQNETFKHYTSADGLVHDQANQGSFYKTESGEFFLGTMNGFSKFDVNDFIMNKSKPVTVISNFYLFNKPVLIGTHNNRKILSKSVVITDSITLNYDENIFAIEFASLDYTNPAKNIYQYKMQGFLNEWHTVSSDDRKAVFTNLDPGNYIFRVKGTNNDGIWSDERVLFIQIIPPYYKTTWFRIFVFLIGGSVLWLFYSFRVKSIRQHNKELETEIEHRTRIQKEKERLNKILKEKNKELEQIIYVSSHDLRTPLVNVSAFSKELEFSLIELFNAPDIKASIEKLSPQILRLVNEEIPDSISMISKNVIKMDYLLKGLLDYSRLGRELLNIELIKMNSLMEQVIKMEQDKFVKKIQINIEELPNCYADYNKLFIMFSQLINNAIQFSDKNREIQITVTGETGNDFYTYKISDNGIGIDPALWNKIFDVYYKINPDHTDGIGLGLPIANKLALLHEGNIEVNSKPGEWTEFSVRISKNLNTKQ